MTLFPLFPLFPANFSHSKEDHEGQFVRRIQETTDYYRQLGVQRGLLKTPLITALMALGV